MVKETKKGGKAYFVCEECGFAYGTENLAQECEDWCRKHHSCSLEITKHAVNLRQS